MNEAELDEVPRELRLAFSEPADLGFTVVELAGPQGVPIRVSELRLEPDSPNVVLDAGRDVPDTAAAFVAGQTCPRLKRWRRSSLIGYCTHRPAPCSPE
jgi:hypothetical protein